MNYEFITAIQAIFAVGCAFAAEKRGGNPISWFILGAIFGPLAFIIALTGGKRCRYCLSVIPKDSKICRYCNKEL
jgi:hypothetical protein